MARAKPEVEALRDFSEWAKKLKGYEKGEAQTFLDRLLRAFGHKGALEAGATFEPTVKRSAGRRGTTGFIDMLWQPRVLFEMKSRGEKLERHLSQAIEYWWNLAPSRPEYVVLCNFDEFWIFNFNKEVQAPLARLTLEDLPQTEALAFLKPEPAAPIFDPNRIAVTEDAATQVASVFRSMVDERGIEREVAQRFILQCVMALFSEDLGLLPKAHFTRIVRESLEDKRPGQRAEELIGSLFHQMNSKQLASKGSRNEGVRYFNGGLYATVQPVVLTNEELAALDEAAKHDWSNINPAIFGTLFQQSMDAKERHRRGAHFTSENDILKVVNPTIVRPWRERIERADNLKALLKVREELLHFRVLDPACGSGNFLYVAFRELKRIETELLLAIREEYKGKKVEALRSYLSVKQFFGFDVLPFAVELAKVTLLLGKEIALAETLRVLDEEQGTLVFDTALPLDNLDENIRRADALFTEWPKVDAIVGNPPFQAKNKAQKEMGRGYLGELRDAVPEVSGRADYAVYFFRKAHNELRPGCRAGLVGTNTIRQNESREGGLDYIVQNGGTITEAVSTQPWSGDATVHVSIVNWIKGPQKGKKKLWYEEENEPARFVVLDDINSALSDGVDVSAAKRLRACAKDELCAQGQTHGHKSFLIASEDAQALLQKHPKWAEVLVPFLIGDDLLGQRDGKPTRYAIDFGKRTVFEAKAYPELLKIVETNVLPKRKEAAQEEQEANREARAKNPRARTNKHHTQFLEHWWQFSYGREALMSRLATLKRYIVCVRVTKRPIFEFVGAAIHPNDALQVFPFEDDYSFGILQSSYHWKWFTARCSTLKAEPRYTSDTVFDTFPWPNNVSARQAKAVAAASVALREHRRELMAENGWSLRDLYRVAESDGTNSMKDAQAALDETVAEAYGMKVREQEKPLAFLLALNQQLAAAEAAGEDILGPGLPPTVKSRRDYITDDCIEP